MTNVTSDAHDRGDASDEHPGSEPSGFGEPSEGQVLGRTVPLSQDVTRAEPGSPETGARRDESGRAIAE